MVWLVIALGWLLLFPVVGIGLSFLGGPIWWLLGAAFIAWQVFEYGTTSSAAEAEANWWQTVAVLVLGAVSVIGLLWVVLNAKAWNAAARAFGGGKAGLLGALL